MPALSHANAAAAAAVVLAIVVDVAVVVLTSVVAMSVFVVEAPLIALIFFGAYDRGFQDKTARRSVEHQMGRHNSKAWQLVAAVGVAMDRGGSALGRQQRPGTGPLVAATL